MDSTKGKSKANRDEKQATAKLDEQIEKVRLLHFRSQKLINPPRLKDLPIIKKNVCTHLVDQVAG